MKHRFAEERAADRHSVKTAGQFAIAPAFNRVRVSEFMQALVALDYFLIDPCVFALRALPDYFRESCIDLDFENPIPPRAPDTVRHMKRFQWDNAARIW